MRAGSAGPSVARDAGAGAVITTGPASGVGRRLGIAGVGAGATVSCTREGATGGVSAWTCVELVGVGLAMRILLGQVELAQGEPDFNTPDHVIEAAYRAMHAGQTHYTPVDGTPELKAAIVCVGPHDFSAATWGTGAFTVKRMKQLEQHIIDIAERQLDELARHLGQVVLGRLVDDVGGQFQVAQARLVGHHGQLPGGLHRAAPQSFHQDSHRQQEAKQ